MRELNLQECEMAGGGIIRVNSDGEVISATQGEMTWDREGNYILRTNDGWSYYKNIDNTWSLWNNDQLVSSGIYKLNPE